MHRLDDLEECPASDKQDLIGQYVLVSPNSNALATSTHQTAWEEVGLFTFGLNVRIAPFPA